MKKFAIMLLAFLIIAPCYAGVTFYEKGDLKVGIEDATGAVLYDFNQRQWLGGVKTSIVQYKSFNLDLGVVGDITNLNDLTDAWGNGEVDGWLGLSYDLPTSININENVCASIGAFVGDRLGDFKVEKETVRYGVFGGLTVKF